jgi:hypothetical protein
MANQKADSGLFTGDCIDDRAEALKVSSATYKNNQRGCHNRRPLFCLLIFQYQKISDFDKPDNQ